MQRLGNLQRRSIAVVQGACLGGGLEFALSCRYRLGCENGRTMLGLPETKLGLLPGWGGTQMVGILVQHRIGGSHALAR